MTTTRRAMLEDEVAALQQRLAPGGATTQGWVQINPLSGKVDVPDSRKVSPDQTIGAPPCHAILLGGLRSRP